MKHMFCAVVLLIVSIFISACNTNNGEPTKEPVVPTPLPTNAGNTNNGIQYFTMIGGQITFVKTTYATNEGESPSSGEATGSLKESSEKEIKNLFANAVYVLIVKNKFTFTMKRANGELLFGGDCGFDSKTEIIACTAEKFKFEAENRKTAITTLEVAFDVRGGTAAFVYKFIGATGNVGSGFETIFRQKITLVDN